MLQQACELVDGEVPRPVFVRRLELVPQVELILLLDLDVLRRVYDAAEVSHPTKNISFSAIGVT